MGWRIHLAAIHSAFLRAIAVFPEPGGRLYAGPTLFLGGGDSDYIPVHDHGAIQETFPRARWAVGLFFKVNLESKSLTQLSIGPEDC